MRNSAYDNQIKFFIMRKKLLFLAVAALMSLSAWAETPQETHKKHPKAMCMFLSTPKFAGNLEGFDIERIAIYPITQKVAIKTTQRDKDVVKNIEAMFDNDEGTVIVFTDGSAISINTQNHYFMYLSTKKEHAAFKLDEYRQEMYEGIIGEYNTDER